ncbi:MAG: ribosome biogenesis GTPase Der [Nitrospiria bacterium]
MQRPILAIIGRPNVGKSRLFNRLLGRRVAIVEDEPGITRDRNYASCDYLGRPFTIVDTGGLDPTIRGGIMAQVRDQTKRAIEEADLLLFLMDGKEGVTPVDEEIVRLLRRTPKSVYYVVNKIDGPKAENRMYDFYRLGIDQIYPISAEHGYGVAELLEQVVKAIPLPEGPVEIPEEYPKIAVVGRPNVGKSTLVNTFLGEDRLLTSEIPGTTRDSIDTLVGYKDRNYVFIDTAGIRRRGRIEWGVERFSVARALKSLERCDVALLLIDGQEGVVEQDTKLMGQILKLGKGCILLINKWDLREKEPEAMENFRAELERRFAYVSHVPTLFLSALSGKKIPQVFSLIDRVMIAYSQRISTGDLNRFFEGIVKSHPPPSYRSHRVKLYYFTQAGTRPPVFVSFCNYPAGISSSYLRYLENQIRATFGFLGVPIKILIRRKR